MTPTGTLIPGPVLPPVDFRHLYRLTDDVGLFEHAEFTRPREAHAYCVDDVSRGLVAVAREPRPDGRQLAVAQLYLHFVLDAQGPDGGFRNRRALDGSWEDSPSVEDCWGRALWSLGTTAARLPRFAAAALAAFDRGAARRSEYPRAMAFAGLGAAALLAVEPGHPGARALLADAASAVGIPGDDVRWRWPEDRLRYANAALAEVLLLAGARLGDRTALDRGLVMLGWLLDVESVPGHLSITPVDGWSLGEPRPAFDQQPIEVAALADACATAFDVTGDPRWADAVRLCAAWFLGLNDAAVSLHDPVSGGGCDGLLVYGRNENQGAESTLALLSTLQQAHRVASVR